MEICPERLKHAEGEVRMDHFRVYEIYKCHNVWLSLKDLKKKLSFALLFLYQLTASISPGPLRLPLSHQLHDLLHYIHKSALWSCCNPPACQLLPQYPTLAIPVPPLDSSGPSQSALSGFISKTSSKHSVSLCCPPTWSLPEKLKRYLQLCLLLFPQCSWL